jgi:outer membrane lipoprotein-sorting protein
MIACRAAAGRAAAAVARRVVPGTHSPKIAALAALWCAAVLWNGCAAVRRPVTLAPPTTLPSAAELEAVLAKRRDTVHSLRALAHVRYRDPEESNSSREAIVVARPDRLRVEVLSLFGSVFVLAADDGLLTAYARQENTLYRGHASPENLWRYVRLTLPVSDLVDLVLGTPPLRQTKEADVSFDPWTGSIQLVQEWAHGAQLVWFSPTALPLRTEEQGPDRQTLWRATFDNYESQNGFAVATRIALELPAWQRSLDIALEDIDLNPKLDSAVFAVQTPPGSKVVDLDAVVE